MNSKLLLLVGVLAVLAVVRAADAEEHDADTPLRQAQRAMLAERETATASHANEDVLGMRLQAVAEGAAAYPEKEQPHARRISGAAQSFLPDDKMCVFCQFLSQRIQLDLVGGVHAPIGGSAYGGVATSIIAGVAPVASSFLEEEDAADSEDLIELADSEEDSEEEADEDEQEDEDAAESEEEDAVLLEVAEEDEEESDSEEESEEDSENESEEEEAALIQIAGEDEGEDWQAPEYAERVEAAPVPTALIESEADDFQTPQYIDGVYHTVEGEESDAMTADETDEAEAGTADASEPVFFESSALAAANDEWVTPEFAAAPAAPAVEMADAELTALLAIAEEMVAPQDAATWSTPTYSDEQKPTGNKQYARVVGDANAEHTEEEEEEAAEPALLEETGAAAQQTEVKLFAPRIIRSRSARWGGRMRASPRARINRFRSKGADLFHTAKRYRAADAIVSRPRWNRHEPHSPRHMSQRLIAGMALRNAEHAAYDRLEHYCSTRLPEAYGKYCRPVLRRFRRITEGLSYGDRIPHVCMRVNLCKPSSYVVASPHDRLEERTF